MRLSAASYFYDMCDGKISRCVPQPIEQPDVLQCVECGATETPKWRCGKTLCNRCGARARKDPALAERARAELEKRKAAGAAARQRDGEEAGGSLLPRNVRYGTFTVSLRLAGVGRFTKTRRSQLSEEQRARLVEELSLIHI